MPSSPFRSVLAALLATTLCLPQGAVAQQQMTRADYDRCQSRDEASLRSAIEAITQRALESGLAKLDVRALVGDEWRRSALDDTVDKQVDIAIASVRDETSWGTQLQSLVNKDTAQALAVSAAERVYRSDAMKSAIENLTTAVARTMGRTIELSAADAASPSLECLNSFLGPRFGTAVARVVAEDAKREFRIDAGRGSAQISSGSVLAESSEALTGAVILVVRRQLANLATRVGQRIVGSILGRLVSVVAGGIGVVLIAKDIWELRNGVLPIISSEMKAKTTKGQVQDEIAKAVSEQIGEHTHEIAAATADRVLEIWREFQRGHAKVLELAERHAEFRAYLDQLKPADLPRLDEIVVLLLGSEGEDGIMRRLANGTLAEAVTRLPPAAMEIARETRSLEKALAWTALAGPALQKVVDFGLHKRMSPGDTTQAQLTRILALDDRPTIDRLAGLGRAARDIVLELPDDSLKRLSRGVGDAEFDALSRYLGGLSGPARKHLLEAVSAAPSRMQALASARVRDAVLASRDQAAAVAMMLRPDSGFDLDTVRSDVTLAYEGKVSASLIWDKHPIAIGAAGAAALVLLLILRRLAFGRRRQPRAA